MQAPLPVPLPVLDSGALSRCIPLNASQCFHYSMTSPFMLTLTCSCEGWRLDVDMCDLDNQYLPAYWYFDHLIHDHKVAPIAARYYLARVLREGCFA